MKYIAILSFVLLSLNVTAQDEATQPKQASAGQVLTNHYIRTYQAGMRYNDFSVAKHALYNILVENPQNDSILYSLSLLYFQSQNYASAALTAQDIIAVNPDNLGALEIAAVSYENLGVNDKALETYETLYLKTDDLQTLYKMAFLQFDLEKYAESKTNADILLNKKGVEEMNAVFNDTEGKQKEYPAKVALLNLKGLIAQKQGDNKVAENYYQQALTIAPDFKMAKDNLATLKK
ncbi:tetratricopeptide repeat protein [Fulvivirga lutea]|uniref:Tetratricopeptide repeat protein n=1 Tax=Fulvivirga lutea TaxID=2810512 RepID=A0A974ZZI6_9BACT|nr:tetratricopeptide repeat protein [Fulvivirga lutea]QSE96145.1 tetratricopeptide repeat protein [Fulvivirga lutea]